MFCGTLVEVSSLDQLAGEDRVLFSKYLLWTPGSLPISEVMVKTCGSTVLKSFE